jgi:hypothetical protein
MYSSYIGLLSVVHAKLGEKLFAFFYKVGQKYFVKICGGVRTFFGFKTFSLQPPPLPYKKTSGPSMKLRV